MFSPKPFKSFMPIFLLGMVIFFTLLGHEGFSQNTKGDRPAERPIPPTLGVGQTVKSKKIKSRPARSRNRSTYSARTFRQNKKNLQNNSERPSSGDRVSVPPSRVQVRSASPRQESTKVTRESDYLNSAARPRSGDKPTKANISATGRRVTPKNNPARAIVIYPQSGAFVKNSSPLPPRIEKPSSVRLPSSGKGLRKPKRIDVAWSSPRTASGRKIQERKPAAQQQAWSGNSAGKRLQARTDQSNARKVFSATNKMVHNKSPKPNLKSERGLPLREVRNEKGYTPTAVAVTPSKTVPSVSGTWPGKEKKNVYWGKIFKDRSRITTDLTGGPLRKVDFKSSSAGIAANDTVRSARQNVSTGGLSTAKAPGYKSATKGGRAWSGDLAGKKLRSGRRTSGSGAPGQPLLSLQGAGANLQFKKSDRAKKQRAAASGYGREGKKVQGFPAPKGAAAAALSAAALRQQLMYGSLKPVGKALLATGLIKPAGFVGINALSGKNLFPRTSARQQGNNLLLSRKEKNISMGNLDVRSVPGKTRLAGGTIAMKQFSSARSKVMSKANMPLTKSSGLNLSSRKINTALRPSQVQRSILMHKVPISLKGWTTTPFEKGTPQGITVIIRKPAQTNSWLQNTKINPAARQREFFGFNQRYPLGKRPSDFKSVSGYSGNLRLTRPDRMPGGLRSRTEDSLKPVDVSGWNQNYRVDKIPGDFKQVAGYTGSIKYTRPERNALTLKTTSERPLKQVDVSGWNQNYRIEKIPSDFKQVVGYAGNIKLTDAYRSKLISDRSLTNPFKNSWVKHPQADPEALKKRRPDELINLTAGLQKDRTRLEVPNKNPDLINLNYPSEKFNSSVVTNIASYSGKESQKDYVKSPAGVENALKVVNPYKAPLRQAQFQVGFRIYNERRELVPGAHPDARFAQLKEDNVKGERSQLSGIKMLWSKTFRKNELQPSSTKQKIRRPRYDPREVGIWYD